MALQDGMCQLTVMKKEQFKIKFFKTKKLIVRLNKNNNVLNGKEDHNIANIGSKRYA